MAGVVSYGGREFKQQKNIKLDMLDLEWDIHGRMGVYPTKIVT